MNIIHRQLAALVLLVPAGAMAGGSLNLERDVTVNAPAEEVWQVIRDYCAIEVWHPAVTSCESEGGEPGVGDLRVLTLGNGKQLREFLTEYNDGRGYAYSIPEADPEALPVSNYDSTLSVEPLGDGRSRVVWQGSFDRANPEQPATEQMNDELAMNVVSSVYEGGLAMIRDLAEAMK